MAPVSMIKWSSFRLTKTYFENILKNQKLRRVYTRDRQLNPIFMFDMALLETSYGKLILEHLQRLSQLSAVDGALILTHELELVAFGAKLQACKWKGKTLAVQMDLVMLVGVHLMRRDMVLAITQLLTLPQHAKEVSSSLSPKTVP